MAIWETRGNQDNYELVINVDELMGFDVEASAVPQIGEAIIRRIVDRTRDGLDVDGRTQRPQYSDEYKQSFAFESTGKTRKVNLTLFGSMLNLLTIKEVNGQELVLGWNDGTENAKAFNHDTGDTLPQREFLGLSPADERRIQRQFRNFRVDNRTTLSSLFNSIFGN